MDAFVRTIGRVNDWVGRITGLLIVAIVLIIIREVVGRSVFHSPSVWADESMTYAAGIAYLMGGGYTYLHRKHVQVDVVYTPVAKRSRAWKTTFDVIAFLLFAIYCVTLIWFGWQLGFSSFLEHESSGTLWDPPIWPLKFAIPFGALLLLLQGFANLLIDLGLARPWTPDDATPEFLGAD